MRASKSIIDTILIELELVLETKIIILIMQNLKDIYFDLKEKVFYIQMVANVVLFCFFFCFSYFLDF